MSDDGCLSQEEDHNGRAAGRAVSNPLTAATYMGQAIAFVLIVVAFGIFMPDVLHALSTFLLVLLTKSTAFVNAIPTNTAMVSQTLGH